MALDIQPKQVELARWDLRVADLERRVAEQERRRRGFGRTRGAAFHGADARELARTRARFAAAPVTPFSCGY